jgi:hypothetical protein
MLGLRGWINFNFGKTYSQKKDGTWAALLAAAFAVPVMDGRAEAETSDA